MPSPDALLLQRPFHRWLLGLIALAAAFLAWSLTVVVRSDPSAHAPAAGAPARATPPEPSRVALAAPGIPDDVPGGGRSPSRASEAVSLPGGVLRSSDGRPCADATLAWTVLLPEFEAFQYLRELDPARVAAVTVTTRSDAAGRFRFAEPPAELGEHSSVVWVTDAAHEAARVALAPGEVWNGALELRARTPLRVRVTCGGAPVAGARVRQQLSFWGTDPPAGERGLRRAFLREGTSGADGTLELCAGAGDNALQAFLGEERSLLFSAPPGREVELELLPSIEVSGRVLVDGAPAELADVRYGLSYFDAPDGSDRVQAHGTLAVRADGTFGPDRWPRAALPRTLLSVFGGEIVGVEAEAATPEPGGSLHLELATRVGLALDALVHTPDGKPLAGAFVYAFRPAGDSWSFAAQAASGEDGRAEVHGLPAGALWFQFGKRGFTTVDVSDHRAVVPRAEEGPLAVVLRPAGVIAGRVTSAGAPVKRFSLSAWTGDRSYETFVEREDEAGEFELENAPSGEPVHLYAYTAEMPQSETTVVVPADSPVEVQLELPRPRRGRGRVVDSLTGAPVAGATLTHATAGPYGLNSLRGRPMAVGADGRFELDGFFPGRGGFAVRAEGYEPLNYSTRVDDVEVVEVGLVPLNPLCTLEVYVREEGVGDYSAYRAWNQSNDDPTPLPMRADGTLDLVSRTGRYEVHVAAPDGSVRVESGVATPGSEEVVEFDLTQGLELEVLLRTPPRDVAGCRLSAWWRAGDDERRVEAGWSEEREAFVLAGLAAGSVVLQLTDANGTSLGQRALALADRSRQSVTLELGGARRRVRLVDSHGKPWSSCTVHATLPGGGGWYAAASTDANGEFELGPLEERALVLSARLGNESLAYGQAVTLEPDPARTTIVALEPGERSLLKLVELGAPRAGVHVAYRHAAAPHAVEFTYASDEEGLVQGPFCAPGTYELRFNHRDYWPARPSVRIDGSRRAPVVLELYSLGELDLAVTDLGGRALAGARLALRHRELGADLAAWIAAGLYAPPSGGLVSDGEGRLVLARVPRGTYEYEWTAPSGETVTGELELAPRGRATAVARIALEQ